MKKLYSILAALMLSISANALVPYYNTNFPQSGANEENGIPYQSALWYGWYNLPAVGGTTTESALPNPGITHTHAEDSGFTNVADNLGFQKYNTTENGIHAVTGTTADNYMPLVAGTTTEDWWKQDEIEENLHPWIAGIPYQSALWYGWYNLPAVGGTTTESALPNPGITHTHAEDSGFTNVADNLGFDIYNNTPNAIQEAQAGAETNKVFKTMENGRIILHFPDGTKRDILGRIIQDCQACW